MRFLDWARTAVSGRVLFTSSCENYASFFESGLLPVPTPEDVFLGVKDITNPRWTYAASKMWGEVAFAQWGHDHTIVRFHNVYGPAMYSRHVVPEVFSKIWQGVSPLLVPSAGHTRTFCHVRDAALQTVTAMEHPDSLNRVVNIGSDDDEITIGDLVRRMVKISGRDVPVEADEDVRGSVSRRRADLTFLRTLLPEHRLTSMDDGLQECWDWQVANRWIA